MQGTLANDSFFVRIITTLHLLDHGIYLLSFGLLQRSYLKQSSVLPNLCQVEPGFGVEKGPNRLFKDRANQAFLVFLGRTFLGRARLQNLQPGRALRHGLNRAW